MRGLAPALACADLPAPPAAARSRRQLPRHGLRRGRARSRAASGVARLVTCIRIQPRCCCPSPSTSVRSRPVLRPTPMRRRSAGALSAPAHTAPMARGRGRVVAGASRPWSARSSTRSSCATRRRRRWATRRASSTPTRRTQTTRGSSCPAPPTTTRPSGGARRDSTCQRWRRPRRGGHARCGGRARPHRRSRRRLSVSGRLSAWSWWAGRHFTIDMRGSDPDPYVTLISMYYWACLFSFQNSEKTLTLTNRDGLHSRETMERRREDMQARGHADPALHLGGALELI